MRWIFYFFAIFSLGLFIYSAVHLSDQFDNNILPHLGEIKGFEDVKKDDEFGNLADKFHQKIQLYNDAANHDQVLYFWVSFLVTGLTAASTLVSTMQAAKKDSTVTSASKPFAIIIAILAFCSTLSNFASNHFNELKTEETKKATGLTSLRDQFFADYDKAAESGKHAVVTAYQRKLD
jgi:ABC-type transport system involved in Fe-S cluster assembly fused permease/ATPase subunit